MFLEQQDALWCDFDARSKKCQNHFAKFSYFAIFSGFSSENSDFLVFLGKSAKK